MNLKSLYFLSKIILITTFMFFTLAAHSEDAVSNRLLFAESEQVVKDYRAQTPEQRKEWVAQRHTHIANASLPELLVTSAYYYKTTQYELAKQHSDLLISKTTSSTPLIITANAWFLSSMITAIGLDQFDGSLPAFEKTIEILNSTIATQSNRELLELSVVANYRLGSLLLFLKKTDSAKNYLTKAIVLAKKASDRSYLVTPTLELAKYYIAKNDPVKAEHQLIESYDIALATESSRRPDILHQLSRYYRKNKRYDLAIDYATRSLRYRQSQVDQLTHLPSAYNNLAIAYEESGDLNSALLHYLNAIKILEGKTGYHYLALATHNTGLIYQKQDKLDLALKYLLDANTHFQAMGHNYFLMSNHLSLADVYFAKGLYPETIKYGELALAPAVKHSQDAVTYDALRFLSKAYLETQQYEKAAQYFQRYSAFQNKEKESLEEKLSEKDVSYVSDNADLKTNLYEVKSALNAEELISAQQRRTIDNMTSLLYFVVVIIIVMSLLYLRTKRRTNYWQQQNNIDQGTQLTYLHNEKILLKTVNQQFISHSNIFALKLPLLTQLLDAMDIDQAQAFRIHLIKELSQFIEQPLYKLSEDTFIFAKTPSEEHSIAQRFNALIGHYLSLIPQELNELATQNTIMLGCINRQPTDKAVNLIQAKNMINLSLTALSAVKQHQTWEAKNNWLMLTEKENSSTTMFTCPTRKEWLQLVSNHMLTVESGLDQEIDWQNVPHYDQ